MEWYYLTSAALTVAVSTDTDGVIVTTPPIARRFVGQPLANLIRWMRRQGGFDLTVIPRA